MVFDLLTDAVCQRHLSQPYLHRSEVVKSVSHTELTVEDISVRESIFLGMQKNFAQI